MILTDFKDQSLFRDLGPLHKTKLYKAFTVSRGSCKKFNKLPQVMSLKLALVGSKDYKSGNEKTQGKWR